MAVACLLLGALGSSVAQAEEGPEAIARRAFDNDLFTAKNAIIDIEIDVTKDGKSVRKRRIVTKARRSGDETRAFVEFLSPGEVAGTKFLSIKKPGASAEQLIYLPAYKKVKRIVGAQRTTSFMGTDFSYADLDGRNADSASWSRLPDAEVSGSPCYVIEGKVKDPAEEEYGKSILWVHHEHFVPMRIDLYEKDGSAVKKRFAVQKLEKHGERWVAVESTMATPVKGTETRLKALKVDLGASISDEDLSRRALER